MARKPKPTSKERRRQKRLEEAIRHQLVDHHHILFDKCLWDGLSHRELRRDADMIVLMDRDIHNELHRKVPPVPPLGRSMTMTVSKCYRQLKCSAKRGLVGEGNPVIGIALLKTALDQVANKAWVTDLELRQIALIQDNLDAQVEYILRSNEIIGQYYLNPDNLAQIIADIQATDPVIEAPPYIIGCSDECVVQGDSNT